MRVAAQEGEMDSLGDVPPGVTDIMITVVQALVDQGHEVPEITQAMRYVADLTDITDRVHGEKM